MNRTSPERELSRILQQLGLLDEEGRARPDALGKIHKLARGRIGAHKTRLAADALALMDRFGSRVEP